MYEKDLLPIDIAVVKRPNQNIFYAYLSFLPMQAAEDKIVAAPKSTDDHKPYYGTGSTPEEAKSELCRIMCNHLRRAAYNR